VWQRRDEAGPMPQWLRREWHAVPAPALAAAESPPPRRG
jgi:hypothetical protein